MTESAPPRKLAVADANDLRRFSHNILLPLVSLARGGNAREAHAVSAWRAAPVTRRRFAPV